MEVCWGENRYKLICFIVAKIRKLNALKMGDTCKYKCPRNSEYFSLLPKRTLMSLAEETNVPVQECSEL
jgi:hypothetical protein